MHALLSLLHAVVTMQKMTGDAIVSTLWNFKCLWGNYGKIVVWCYRTQTFLVFNHAKLAEIIYKNPVNSNAVYQQGLW